jgi:dephospho-CoA kinase
MFVVGLTGGIGSGKTTVSERFAAKGVTVVDADVISHQITARDMPAWQAIVEHFGEGVLEADRNLDRAKLRSLVFASVAERQWLEKLLHPLIRAQMQAELEKATSPYSIVVIPLLVETGPYSFINRVLVVDADEETQLQRLTVRDKAKREDLEKIIRAQIDRQVRLGRAQDLILNNGDLGSLQSQVDRLHEYYLTLP